MGKSGSIRLLRGTGKSASERQRGTCSNPNGKSGNNRDIGMAI